MGDFGLLFLFVLLVVSFSSPRDADNLSLRVENVCISRRGTLFYCTSFWNLHISLEKDGKEELILGYEVKEKSPQSFTIRPTFQIAVSRKYINDNLKGATK